MLRGPPTILTGARGGGGSAGGALLRLIIMTRRGSLAACRSPAALPSGVRRWREGGRPYPELRPWPG